MKPQVDLCVPTLQSNDAIKSYEFYHSVLGFEKNWEHRFEPELPLFISMSNGVNTVFITEHKNESAFGMELYFYVKKVDSLVVHAKSQGVAFDVELHETPYGTKEFTIKDPDGNKLRIGQLMT